VKPVGPCFSLYHDKETKEFDWDIEVAEPIDVDLKESGAVKVTTLSHVEHMACTVHNGPFETISQAYDALLKWWMRTAMR
jgi:effector-binding domain-containing protein